MHSRKVILDRDRQQRRQKKSQSVYLSSCRGGGGGGGGKSRNAEGLEDVRRRNLPGEKKSDTLVFCFNNKYSVR